MNSNHAGGGLLRSKAIRKSRLETAEGGLIGTFILTFFLGTVKEIWASGNWTGFISWKISFSLSLFVFTFFIPKII
jgi:hypothetical protein